MRRQTWLFVFLSAAILYSCSSPKAKSTAESSPAVPAKAVKDRKPAPTFTLKDENGAAVKLADYRGKVVLLNFWATWCGPCKIEIPWFQEFEQQYKTKGFAVLGVSMDEDGWTAVKPFIASHKLNYRILLGDDSVGQLYGGLDALPTTFILDREGRVAFTPHVGLVDKNEYSNEIQSLLNETASASLRAEQRSFAPALLWAAK